MQANHQKVFQDIINQKRLIYGIEQYGNDTLALIVGPFASDKAPFNPQDYCAIFFALKLLKTRHRKLPSLMADQ